MRRADAGSEGGRRLAIASDLFLGEHHAADTRFTIANDKPEMRLGEELAALIPDSRLVALSSNNHLLTAAESAWQMFRAEVDAFLA